MGNACSCNNGAKDGRHEYSHEEINLIIKVQALFRAKLARMETRDLRNMV